MSTSTETIMITQLGWQTVLLLILVMLAVVDFIRRVFSTKG